MKNSNYREEVLERAREISPKRERMTNTLGQKWARTGNWKMRQRIGSIAERIRMEIETVSNAEKYDPWLVAESLLDIQDELKNLSQELKNI